MCIDRSVVTVAPRQGCNVPVLSTTLVQLQHCTPDGVRTSLSPRAIYIALLTEGVLECLLRSTFSF